MYLNKFKLCLILAVLTQIVVAQVASPTAPTFYLTTKDFSKDIALFRAKSFVVSNILGPSENTIQFELDPLAAASSGELTSLVYRSPTLKKEGLILGFFGSKWNSAGVVYQAYEFKNLPYQKAIELFSKIDDVVRDNTKYLNADANSNNITFSFDDLIFIIDFNTSTNIRVFWKDFDATWDGTAYKRTKRRLLKKLD